MVSRTVGLLLLLTVAASARDDGQWELTDPAVREWFENLKQPDYPSISCCSFADAYYVDKFYTNKDGKNIAVITDERDDAPLRRPHVDIGTEIEVPDAKMKQYSGNPTGRGVIFMSSNKQVLCFVLPTQG